MGRLLIAIGVVLLSIWGLRLAFVANALQTHLRQAEAFASTPKDVSLGVACDLAQDLRDDIITVKQEVGLLVTAAPLFGWLPHFGGDLQVAPQLLATADGLSEAGAIACAALAPMLDAFDQSGTPSGGFSIEQVVRMLADHRSDLDRAVVAANRSQAAWVHVDYRRLSPSLARRAELLDRSLPLVRAGVGLLSIAPDLLGVNGQRTYLIVAQNEDELRATGGYITGVGEVQLQGGHLAAMTFRDSYAVDDFSQPYPDPPEPLYRYMQIDQWVFRDSNWSPDFPTTAQQIVSLYRHGYPLRVDGVIALDQHGLQELVGALGPLDVKEADAPITGENIIAYIRRAWAPSDGVLTGQWWSQRKSFMGPLAEAAWERIKNGQFGAVVLGQTIVRMLEQKHVLIYSRDARAAKLLAERGWNGALRFDSGDALMVVDSNVGYNKSNARIREELAYQVDLRSPTPQATLTLTYTHTSKANYPCKPEIRYDPVYEQAMDRCYFDYLRVYVPPGSQLLDATRISVPGQALFSGKSEPGSVSARPAMEGPGIVFEVMAVLPTAATQTRAFMWALPPNVVKWEESDGWYLLHVQKQPGTLGHPLTVRVRLPEKSTLVEAMPEQIVWEGEWLVYQATLERDQDIRLHFRRASK
jgi:hypothetical protein